MKKAWENKWFAPQVPRNNCLNLPQAARIAFVFLKNHLIKDIPSHLSDPTKSIERDNTRPNKQVLISVDKGILTALISLQRAVSRSTKPDKISGLAKYWSEISWLIEEEINQSYDRLLKEHLKEAKRNLAPGKMEALIYDTAY